MRRPAYRGARGRDRYLLRWLHHDPHPALVAGSLYFMARLCGGYWPVVERMGVLFQGAKRMLSPPKLVQIGPATPKEIAPRAD